MANNSIGDGRKRHALQQAQGKRKGEGGRAMVVVLLILMFSYEVGCDVVWAAPSPKRTTRGGTSRREGLRPSWGEATYPKAVPGLEWGGSGERCDA